MNRKYLLLGGIVLALVLLSKESPSDKEPATPTREKGIVPPSVCINKIHVATGYDKTRLRYTDDNDYFVFVHYKNNYGRVHNFRCAGPSGTIELFANGAGAWLEM